MNFFKKSTAIIALLALICTCAVGCADDTPPESPISTEPDQTKQEPIPPDTSEPVPPDPIDISTTGGVVIVGTVGNDENGWFLTPEIPLNVEFHYFLDNPTMFEGLTRIELFDPKVDGIEKLTYLGETVTIEGAFKFYRDFFDKLYILPYRINFGKTVAQSHAAPDLAPPDMSESLYDPSKPLPSNMEPSVRDGQFVYNTYMLSRETLELMGNDFAEFYCDFVDAFLNYKTECPCPNEDFAKMLGTVIYYEFPLYDACASSFEFIKHYDPQKKQVTIEYKYDQVLHQQKIDEFMSAANTFLSTASPDQTEAELAKNIYHELCTRVTYDDSALTKFERKNAYYAYMNKSGVCVTFANVYNQLLTQVGIQATTAQCDYTPTMGHVWSLITVDEKQYFCDPTFELNFDKGAYYRYFGQTYAQRLADGLGANGITAGRYSPYALDETHLSDTVYPF